MVTIIGTVGSSGKYLVTGMPVASKAHTPLKITFENNTGGTNLGLWAGSLAAFETATQVRIIGLRRSGICFSNNH